MALPFDAASAQVSGDVFPVAEGVSVTSDGIYVPSTVSKTACCFTKLAALRAATNWAGLIDPVNPSVRWARPAAVWTLRFPRMRSRLCSGALRAPGPICGCAI